MAAITSAQSGLWSATSTWVGGVVPGIADTVTIAATHIVTLDGTVVTGGDTATGFVVRGTVKASRTVSSSLTVRANINVAQADAGLDFGTNSDPIPQGITAELVVNASATPAGGKYNISQTVNGVSFRFCGAPKTRNAFLTAPVSAGATSIQVTSTSGWVVGDSLFLEQPTNDVAQTQTVTITSISGTTVGVSAVTLARVSGLAVSNISCNVLIRSQVDTSVSANYLQVSSTAAPNGLVEVRNCEIRNIGYLYLNWNSGSSVPPATPATFDSCYLNSTTSSISMIGSTFGSLSMPFQNNILIGGINYTQQNLIHPNNSSLSVLNSVFYNLSSNSFSGALGYNGLSELRLTNCRINSYVNCLTIANANSHIYTNCRFRSKTAELISTTLCNVQTIDCDFLSQGSIKYLKSYGNSGGVFSMQNPIVDDPNKINPSAVYGLMRNPAYNINNVFTSNREYTYNSAAINQNTVLNRATRNIALQRNNSQTTGTYTFSFQGVSGVAQRIIGYLRHDTTYGASNPPSISFSGAGVSGSFTSSTTVNIWEKFDITLTPTSTGTITATVTFAGATNGTAYLDGVYQFPFITENWIYGFQKLAQVNSVIDSNITLSESAVAALSSSATFDNVYDSATYWSVVNGPTLGSYIIIVSASGTDLNFGSNSVVIDNGAASNFSYSGTTATIKSSALTKGAKFDNLIASSITMTTPITNATLTSNVSQATPTNLTGVTINGDLTYNTNTPITITLTNCAISGTISNSGTGLVTINLTNSIIGSTGSNVISRLTTSLTINGLAAGSQIYIATEAGTQVDYVASSGTSYTLDTTGGTGTWIYKVARYGYISQSGNHLPANANTTISISLIADVFITQATKATVGSYTTLENPDKIYDYAAYFETTNAGIVISRVISKAATFASAGSYALVLNNTGAVWDLTSGILTLRITNNFVGGSTITGGLLTTGAITLNAQASSAGNYAIISGNSISIFAANYQNLVAIASISGFPTLGSISAAGSIDFGNSTIAATGDLSASNTSFAGVLNITTSSNRILNLTNCSSSGFTINASGGGSILVRCLGTTLATAITAGTNVTIIKVAPITAPNLLSGSRVRLYNITDSVEIYNDVLSSAGFSYDYSWTENKTMKLTATYQNGTTAKLTVAAVGVVTSSGLQFLDSQVDDAIYNSYALDGSAITKFQADYVNDQIDLRIATDFLATELYAWWVYNLTTINGIRDFVGGITAEDAANLRINASIISVKLDNITATDLIQTDNIRIYRSDSVYPVVRPTSGGGGINVNWQNQVYVADLDSSAIERILINTNLIPGLF